MYIYELLKSLPPVSEAAYADDIILSPGIATDETVTITQMHWWWLVSKWAAQNDLVLRVSKCAVMIIPS